MSDPQVALSQHAHRISSLEDLLRRNEGSVGAILGRLRDIELALNSVNRVSSRVQPEVQLLAEDMGAVKRKVDTVDHTWRLKAQELDATIRDEVINNRPVPLENNPSFLRVCSDLTVAREDVADLHSSHKRLAETVSIDEKNTKQLEQDHKWLLEQFRDQVAQQREFTQGQARRNEQLLSELSESNHQRERGHQQLQSLVDAVVRQMRDELAVKFEAEAKARLALQTDIVQAFSKMREDVVKGFSQTASNLRNLDETAHSLETVLRAEVRSRMGAQEELYKRMDGVEERVKREANSAAEYLKALDGQMSGALRDVREVTASECRSQLERVWRSIGEMRETLDDLRRSSHNGSHGSNSEVAVQRQQLQLDTELTKLRESVLDEVNNRLTTALPNAERVALKSDLRDAEQSLDVKIEQVRNEFHRKEGQSASASLVKFETEVANLDTRVEESERHVRQVADTLNTAQRDLSDKIDTMGVHAKAIDTLQKNLQTSWERDQKQMESILLGMREQVLLLAQEHELEGKQNEEGEDGGSGEDGPTDKVSRAQMSLLDKDMQELKQLQRTSQADALREIQELKVAAADQKAESDAAIRHLQEKIGVLEDGATHNPKKNSRAKSDPFTKTNDYGENEAMKTVTADVETLRKAHEELDSRVSKDVTELQQRMDSAEEAVRSIQEGGEEATEKTPRGSTANNTTKKEEETKHEAPPPQASESISVTPAENPLSNNEEPPAVSIVDENDEEAKPARPSSTKSAAESNLSVSNSSNSSGWRARRKSGRNDSTVPSE